MNRPTARRAVAVLTAVGLALGLAVVGAGSAAAAPDQCTLLIICPPDDPTTPPGSTPAAPSTTRPPPSQAPPSQAPPSQAPPSQTSPSSAGRPSTATPPTSSAGTTPGLPLPTGVLPPGVVPTLPGVPPVDGLLPPGLLPPGLLPPDGVLPGGLVMPVLPQVPAESDRVVSGLIGQLTMDALTVTDFQFLGVVEHRTATGGTQRALRISVSSTDITNLGVFMPGPEASLAINQRPGAANAGSDTLILDVTRLRITLFGVLPVEFSFLFPPPPLLVIPTLSGTDVTIDFVQLSAPLLLGPAIDVRTAPPSQGEPTTDPTAPAPTRASLVSLASLLDLPAFLLPYGFTQEEADTAVRDGLPPEEVDSGPPADEPGTGADDPGGTGDGAETGTGAAPESEPPLSGLADVLGG